MKTDSQQFHLVWERSPRPATVLPLFGVIAIPPGPSWLGARAGEPPALGPTRAPGDAPAVMVEPVFAPGRQPRLLLVGTGPHRASVNGQPAPRFAILRDQDLLQLDGEFMMHVAVYREPSIAPAGESLRGKECPVCRVAFKSDTTCYACPCGAAMHCEDDAKQNALQCAQLRERAGCPACGRPLILVAGYSHWPEVEDE